MTKVRASVHGFPRIGSRRELKTALEAFWATKTSPQELLDTGRGLRAANWSLMAAAGVDLVPCNDFSFYDHVLDASVLLDAIPDRHRQGEIGSLERYFAMARGQRRVPGRPAAAMDLTKWFDTNYHYIVPEVGPGTCFALAGPKPFAELAEARSLALSAMPVLVGPVTYLLLSKVPENFNRLSLLDDLLDVYAQVLAELHHLGAEWVQLDEPAFVADRAPEELAALGKAYQYLGERSPRPPIVVSTYFGHPGAALGVLAETPIEGIGLDLVAGPQGLERLRRQPAMGHRTIFAGVVDGRNVWANDLAASLDLLDQVADFARDVVVSSSCSLLHVPVGLAGEDGLPEGLRPRLSFATEKLVEVGLLARALAEGRHVITDHLADREDPIPARSGRRAAGGSVPDEVGYQRSPLAHRRQVQRARFGLPRLPTTTIGSFPQTPELRAARSALGAGRMATDEYESRMRDEIQRVVALQERLGLDVLVHGEPERNDMVQYFAEALEGFASTTHGWVQSYGSRCVRPPVIYGDVHRPEAMTVRWSSYAQSLTHRPLKAMLTGPVTMVAWSFCRDDQPMAQTAAQVARALRAEVADLEAAGIGIIQVDEPAIREGLPLRMAERPGYLAWAVDAFRLVTGAARDETQIHTHMCYSEFSDMLEAIVAMDADVISFEAARSGMDLLRPLAHAAMPGDVGPGVYDIHSSVVPAMEDLAVLIRAAAGVLAPDRLWVNPDCGLKTRSYAEVEPALANMVDAARRIRDELEAPA